MKNAQFQRAAAAKSAIFLGLALACGSAGAAHAQQPVPAVQAAGQSYSYADLADLSSAATVVAKAEIRKQAQVKAERAPGLAPGHARLYVEARTQSLIFGSKGIPEAIRYLIDVPLDSKGKAPKLKGNIVLLFGHLVPSKAGELQLVSNHAQLPADEATEARVKQILVDLTSPDAPPQITGVRDSLSVEGNLAGESETQIFLESDNGMPVSLSIIRRPGMKPAWGVSWTELVDQSARPPQRDTLEWYRLACFMPETLPAKASLTRDRAARDRAMKDYRFVRESLGPCNRSWAD